MSDEVTHLDEALRGTVLDVVYPLAL